MNENAKITQLPVAVETQDTIVAWSRETFGPPASAELIAARAAEESCELASGYFGGGDLADLGAELADVFIVTCQVAELYNIKMLIKDGATAQPHRVLAPQVLNLSAVILAGTVDEKLHITPHLRALQDVLTIMAVSIGSKTLQELVDAKMQINRGRSWKTDKNGVGQHV